ncbi:MAG: Dihydrodipicolinate synthase family protein [Planctomycetaceae bacterium]|nr:Dihydrodipicolinate synthase family protein [Planctomycetaceae bacterium]
MDTRPINSATLAGSVIAVPPLARNADLTLNHAENGRMIRYLEQGGVTTLLYGGNAILNHVSLSEYAELLTLLRDNAAASSLVIPAVGPAFGMMLDQAKILAQFEFPTAMILPTRDPSTPVGLASALRRFVDAFGRPAVLYLKQDVLDVDTIQRLMNDGLISWIKYAIVRDKSANDPFLQGLVDAVGPSLIVTGMGEQPAIVHMRDFKLPSFTAGCVCVAPKLSADMLRAIQAQDFTTAERIRSQFYPLENLRDTINPVRVLHAAVQLAGIAETGPVIPLISPVDESHLPAIQAAAKTLRALAAQ